MQQCREALKEPTETQGQNVCTQRLEEQQTTKARVGQAREAVQAVPEVQSDPGIVYIALDLALPAKLAS